MQTPSDLGIKIENKMVLNEIHVNFNDNNFSHSIYHSAIHFTYWNNIKIF